MPNDNIGFVRYGDSSSPLGELLGTTAERPAPGARDIRGYITEQEFARQVNRRVSTVRRWRKAKPPFGPPAVPIGQSFYYRENAAQLLLDALMEKAEAAREEPKRRGRPRRV